MIKQMLVYRYLLILIDFVLLSWEKLLISNEIMTIIE